jgi:hypothetical protein
VGVFLCNVIILSTSMNSFFVYSDLIPSLLVLKLSTLRFYIFLGWLSPKYLISCFRMVMLDFLVHYCWCRGMLLIFVSSSYIWQTWTLIIYYNFYCNWFFSRCLSYHFYKQWVLFLSNPYMSSSFSFHKLWTRNFSITLNISYDSELSAHPPAPQLSRSSIMSAARFWFKNWWFKNPSFYFLIVLKIKS